ncbi:hypothetical protein SK128_024805, partial [Halocaridina rubra]
VAKAKEDDDRVAIAATHTTPQPFPTKPYGNRGNSHTDKRSCPAKGVTCYNCQE